MPPKRCRFLLRKNSTGLRLKGSLHFQTPFLVAVKVGASSASISVYPESSSYARLPWSPDIRLGLPRRYGLEVLNAAALYADTFALVVYSPVVDAADNFQRSTPCPSFFVRRQSVIRLTGSSGALGGLPGCNIIPTSPELSAAVSSAAVRAAKPAALKW